MSYDVKYMYVRTKTDIDIINESRVIFPDEVLTTRKMKRYVKEITYSTMDKIKKEYGTLFKQGEMKALVEGWQLASIARANGLNAGGDLNDFQFRESKLKHQDVIKIIAAFVGTEAPGNLCFVDTRRPHILDMPRVVDFIHEFIRETRTLLPDFERGLMSQEFSYRFSQDYLYQMIIKDCPRCVEIAEWLREQATDVYDYISLENADFDEADGKRGIFSRRKILSGQQRVREHFHSSKPTKIRDWTADRLAEEILSMGDNPNLAIIAESMRKANFRGKDLWKCCDIRLRDKFRPKTSTNLLWKNFIRKCHRIRQSEKLRSGQVFGLKRLMFHIDMYGYPHDSLTIGFLNTEDYQERKHQFHHVQDFGENLRARYTGGNFVIVENISKVELDQIYDLMIYKNVLANRRPLILMYFSGVRCGRFHFKCSDGEYFDTRRFANKIPGTGKIMMFDCEDQFDESVTVKEYKVTSPTYWIYGSSILNFINSSKYASFKEVGQMLKYHTLHGAWVAYNDCKFSLYNGFLDPNENVLPPQPKNKG